MRIAAQGVAVNEAEARAAAGSALEAQLPPGATLAAETVRLTRTPGLSVDANGQIRFTVIAEGEAQPALDREAIRQAVSGQSVERATELLQNTLALTAPPQVAVRPAWLASWYRVLPWLPLRIEVIVQ
jgi:hypothetical protein